MQRVDQLHDQRDRRVEVPALFEILRYAAQYLVRLALQVSFLGRRIARACLGTGHTPYRRGVPIHHAKNALEEARAALDSLLVPLQIFFRRRRKQCVHARSVAAVFIGHLNRADEIAL